MKARKAGNKGRFDVVSRLSEKELAELGKRMEEGDQDARDLIILSHIPLVKYLANLYASRSVNDIFEDLYQEGCIGLMEAIDRYDYRKAVPLSSYATYYMIKRFQEYIRKQDLIVIPEHMYYPVQQYHKLRYQFYTEHGRLPTAEELSEIMSLPVEKIDALSRCKFTYISLDHSAVSDGRASPVKNETLHSVILPENSELRPVENEVSRRLAELAFHDLAIPLTKREEEVLRRHLGINKSGVSETFPAIAMDLGLSSESVRLCYHDTIRKIHAAAAARGYTIETYPLD